MSGGLLEFLLPQVCVGCGRDGDGLCGACAEGLRAGVGRRGPVPGPEGLPECWAAAEYGGVARRAIVGYKERGRVSLAARLGGVLGAVVAAACPRRPVVVVPVPGSPASRRRGHDHVRALARHAVRRVPGACLVTGAVEAVRAVDDQAGLSAPERAANLAGVFRVPPARAARLRAVCARAGGVVLVDDVVTTGVTLAELAAALRRAGVEATHAATIAATSRRRADGAGRRDHGAGIGAVRPARAAR
ncbi:putative amidophosphoribosyltransferase [Thermocatellispora tengchongensis]|uniref:Putative amidophosphoribosyltransferase n=1 Tax=Thermocatellispora tengchongensis TaxID=1073253 RepID=A0A840PCC2_9ACTN|nr:phosphoribosyltransferase family protein [Thermocatellispora tengchongensis]MBB5134827.1 putative amidophosphoribosyltransferase [Thermocatellispora tengchongensis]